MKQTGFVEFWRLINLQMTRNGLPELPFGAAQELWTATMEDATRAARAAFVQRYTRRAASTGGARGCPAA